MTTDGPPDGSTEETRDAGERRKLQPDRRNRDGGLFTRWLVDTVYYGFVQVWGLGLPALMVAWSVQGPDLDVARGAVAAWVVASVGVGLRRHDVAGLGHDWPDLHGAALGDREGLYRVLARSVYWSTMFALAALGGAISGSVVGSGHVTTATGAVVGLAAVALLPALSGSTPRARATRLVAATAGFALAVAVTRPLDAGITTGTLFLLLYGATILADAHPLLRAAGGGR